MTQFRPVFKPFFGISPEIGVKSYAKFFRPYSSFRGSVARGLLRVCETSNFAVVSTVSPVVDMARVPLWAGEVGPLVPGPVLQVVGLPAPVSHTRGQELGATCHMGHSDRAA